MVELKLENLLNFKILRGKLFLLIHLMNPFSKQ